MADIKSLVRPHLLDIKPYSSARDEYSGKVGVFLDANENPFERENYPGVNRYPDPYQYDVKALLSNLKNVPIQQIFLGNGSDEVIDLLIRAFCEPSEDSIIILPPTYGMYEVSASIHNVGIKKIQLTTDFQLDVKSILSQVDKNDKILFICSPNNPSGNLLNKADILELAGGFEGIIAIDEAYIDFASEGTSLVAELNNFPNMIVMQTLSKAWGFAGLRLGLAFASVEMISLLNKIKPPYNINLLSQQAAIEGLKNAEQVKDWVKILIAERDRLAFELGNLDFVEKVYPSDANFILVKMEKAREVYEKLLHKLIIVRDRSKVVLCDNALRISIGTVEENQKLLEALKNL